MKIRIALREEGKFWNAYLALADTMEGAKLIGSISMGAVRNDKKVKDDFLKLMKRVMSNAIKDTTGTKPTDWEIGPAPEAERSGHS